MKTHIATLARAGLLAFGTLAAAAPALAGAVPGPLLDTATATHIQLSTIGAPSTAGSAGGIQLARAVMRGGGGWHGGSGWHGGGDWHRGGWHRSWGGWDGDWMGWGVPAYPYYGYYAPYDGYDDEPAYVAPRYVAPAQRTVIRMSSAHVRWCEARYRTYRPADNSFQPNHGARRQCLSPYG